MKRALLAAGALLLASAAPALAHRVDEYLQATTIAVGRDAVLLHLRLTPGIEVVPRVLRLIDGDGDGVLSEAEQRGYAERMLRDVALSADGAHLPLRLLSWKYPSLDEMRDGRGSIEVEADARVPERGGTRVLTFDDAHQRAIADYLVNALVPQDSAIHIARQVRSRDQSHYELHYAQAGVPAAAHAPLWSPVVRGGLGIGALLLLTWTVSVARRRGRAPDDLTAAPEP